MSECEHRWRINPDDQLTANVMVWSCRTCGEQRLDVNTGKRIESDIPWQNRTRDREIETYAADQRRNNAQM